MLEITINIAAPELAAAIGDLARAIGSTGASSQRPIPAPRSESKGTSPRNVEPKGLPAPTSPVVEPARPPIPLAQPPQYTVDQIMEAGAALMDAGKVEDLMNLLHSFGVQAVMDLKPEQLGPFAAALRSHGARI